MSDTFIQWAARLLRYVGIGLVVCIVLSVSLFLSVPWAPWLRPWRDAFALGALLPLLAFAFWLKINQFRYREMLDRWLEKHGLTDKDFATSNALPAGIFMAAWGLIGIGWLVTPDEFASYWEGLSFQVPKPILVLVPRQWHHGPNGGIAGLAAIFVILLLACSIWQMIRAFRCVKNVNGIALYRLGVQCIVFLLWISMGWLGLVDESPKAPLMWAIGSMFLAGGILYVSMIIGVLIPKLFPPAREI